MTSPAPRTVEHDQDLVTFVVPARNEEGSIAGCLRSLLAQDWPALEVLVVNGASTDRTADVVSELAASDPRVRLLHNERGIIPVSLNIALREARGRWLVRVTRTPRSAGLRADRGGDLRDGRTGRRRP